MAPGSWPPQPWYPHPDSKSPRPPTHTCRVPSQCVFIRGKVLCKLIVGGVGHCDLPFIHVSWQPRHPQRQSCWGPQIRGDRHPVPLVFPNLDGEPHPPTRRRGEGLGGGVPLPSSPRMLQPPGCNSCFNFVKSKLWFSGNAGSLVHALDTHLWSSFGCLRCYREDAEDTERKAAGLLRGVWAWWMRLVKRANSPYEALRATLQRLLVGTRPGQGTGNTKFKEGWDPACDQVCGWQSGCLGGLAGHQMVPMGRLSPAQDGSWMFSETPAPNSRTARETDSALLCLLQNLQLGD